VPDKPVAPVGISQVFLWVVPGNARGHWVSEIGGDRIAFDIDQTFQVIKAKITAENPVRDCPSPTVRAASLRGEEIHLVVAGNLGGKDGVHRFDGKINGERIDGEILTGTRAPERVEWHAQRR